MKFLSGKIDCMPKIEIQYITFNNVNLMMYLLFFIDLKNSRLGKTLNPIIVKSAKSIPLNTFVILLSPVHFKTADLSDTTKS